MQRFVGLLAALAGVSCASSGPTESLGETSEPLALSAVKPLAEVYVKNAGALDFEGTYLPQVVCCENGAAPPEALKAQAVMARTYAAYSYFASQVGTSGKPLTGTTSDQAYFCSTKVTQACKDAVDATRGEITSFDESGVPSMNLAFFVDGPRPACLASKSCACPKPSPTTNMTPQDHPADCACFTFASMGAANPAYVTYNWSKSGAGVTKSSIGSATSSANRGCGSQNIQSCLAYAGWGYADQLRFFYGQDTTLRNLDGTQVGGGGDGGGSASPPPSGSTGQASPPNGELASPSGSRDNEGGGCMTSPASPRDLAWIVGVAIVLVAKRRRRSAA